MRCIVLVQITTKSAPPRSSRCAASIISAAASSQRPSMLQRLDLAEVEGPHEAPRRTQAAEPVRTVWLMIR